MGMSNLKGLDFSVNVVRKVKFPNLYSLTICLMSGQRATEILKFMFQFQVEDDAFEGLQSLEYLDLLSLAVAVIDTLPFICGP